MRFSASLPDSFFEQVTAERRFISYVKNFLTQINRKCLTAKNLPKEIVMKLAEEKEREKRIAETPPYVQKPKEPETGSWKVKGPHNDLRGW